MNWQEFDPIRNMNNTSLLNVYRLKTYFSVYLLQTFDALFVSENLK